MTNIVNGLHSDVNELYGSWESMMIAEHPREDIVNGLHSGVLSDIRKAASKLSEQPSKIHHYDLCSIKEALLFGNYNVTICLLNALGLYGVEAIPLLTEYVGTDPPTICDAAVASIGLNIKNSEPLKRRDTIEFLIKQLIESDIAAKKMGILKALKVSDCFWAAAAIADVLKNNEQDSRILAYCCLMLSRMPDHINVFIETLSSAMRNQNDLVGEAAINALIWLMDEVLSDWRVASFNGYITDAEIVYIVGMSLQRAHDEF